MEAPRPRDEARRLEVLSGYGILDTPAEAAFDDLARLAAALCRTPIALVSLVDDDRQWFKSHIGLEVCETPRTQSFCAHAILRPAEILQVEDATTDPRFADNPLVTGEPRIRFYAGTPLTSPAGQPLGTLCVIDRVPRTLDDDSLEALRVLARQVVAHLELGRQAAALARHGEEADRLLDLADASRRALLGIIEDEQLARRRLEASEARLAAAQARAHLGSWELDLTTPVATWSAEMARLHYRDPALPAPTFDEFVELIHANDRRRIRTAHATIAERTQPLTLEYRTRADLGPQRTLSATLHVRRDETGTPVRLEGTTIDITERKRADDALRESRERYMNLVQNLEGIVWEARADTFDFTFVSPHAERLLGYPVEAWLDPGFWPAHIHPADREFALAHCATSTRRGETHDFEYRMIAADGRAVWLRDIVTVELRDSRPHLLRGVMVDVTERKRAEKALRESEERYRTLADNATDVILQIDETGAIRMVNRAIERTFGYAPEEVIGRPITMLMPADLAGAHETAFGRYLATGRRSVPWSGVELRALHRSGQEFPVEVSFGEYFADGVRIMSGTIRDVSRRVEAEAARRESLERFQAIARATNDALWDWNIETGEVWRSDAVCELLGPDATRDADAALWRDRIHPDDRSRVFAGLEAVIVGTGQSWSDEYRLRRHDGGWAEVLDRGFLLRAADGRPLRMVGALQDITARKAAERSIRHLNRTYAVLSGINELIVRERDPGAILAGACSIAVERGGFQYAWIGLVDAAGGDLVQAACAHAPGTDTATLPPPDDPVGRASAPRAIETGRHVVCNDLAPGRDGGAPPCSAMASLLLRDGDRIAGAFTLCAAEGGFFDDDEMHLLDELAGDISFALEFSRRESERRRVEADLRASEERFRELAETIREVFWISDPGRSGVLYVSPAYETVWGRSCESLYTTPGSWLEAVHPDDQARVSAAVARQALGEYDIEYRITRPDGATRWIRDQAFPVLADDGTVERIVGVARDVTDRRAAEEQLVQAQKMESVGRLAAGIAHDFNNLLTIINGTAELAVADPTTATTVRDDLSTIRRAGSRAADLTRQLLAFSRRQVLKPEVIDINSLIHDAVTLLRRVIGEHIAISVDCADDLSPIRVDPGQLDQVIMNLAVNSRDAMPDGGTLTIATRETVIAPNQRSPDLPPGRYVVLTVTDTGTGMDAATQEMLFEPFFTTKEPGKGTGLGLATVQGIIKQSGGEVQVTSELGAGTTFTILLPVTASEETETRGEGGRAKPRSNECVLVVDDDDGVREVTRRLLSRAGYAVVTAEDGAAALRLLESHGGPVHLVLTDVVMPGMGGNALATEIRRRWPDMRVLFTTGYTDDAVLHLGVLREDIRLISKPYTARDLTQMVRETLDD